MERLRDFRATFSIGLSGSNWGRRAEAAGCSSIALRVASLREKLEQRPVTSSGRVHAMLCGPSSILTRRTSSITCFR
jgi:hypothetical protein